MPFMERQITRKLEWYKIETTQGTSFVCVEDVGKVEIADSDALQPYCEGEIESWEIVKGYGARLSAPGYLDCTEWAVFDTPVQAEAYMDEYYPEDEEDTLAHRGRSEEEFCAKCGGVCEYDSDGNKKITN